MVRGRAVPEGRPGVLSGPGGAGRKRPGAGGFTLIELLVVMMIIMILSGMLTTAIFAFRRMMVVRAAKFDIRTFTMALAAYKLDLGSYPPDDFSDEIAAWLGGTWTEPHGMNEALVYYLGRKHVVGDNVYGPYMEFKAKRLVDTDDDDFDEYLDPWKNHYLYAENASANAAEPDRNLWVGHSRRSYDLVSAGPDCAVGCDMTALDGYDEESAGHVDAEMKDNITNWTGGRPKR